MSNLNLVPSMSAKLFSRLAFSSVFTRVIDHKNENVFDVFDTFFEFDTDDND